MSHHISTGLRFAGVLALILCLFAGITTSAMARGGGFGGGGFHGGGGGMGGGGFGGAMHAGGFGGGGFHAGAFHAGGMGGTWHDDGFHAGGFDAAGFHGPTVVNHYYRNGCTACRWGAVNHFYSNQLADDDAGDDWLSTLPAHCQRHPGGEYYCNNTRYHGAYGNNGLQYRLIRP